MPHGAENNRKICATQIKATVTFKFSAFGTMLSLLNLAMLVTQLRLSDSVGI